MDNEDKGKHYRYKYNGIKMDPYRICQIYNIGGGPREHMLKKLLRGVDKGHSEKDLIQELQSCLTRWGEMIQEDKQPMRRIPPPPPQPGKATSAETLLDRSLPGRTIVPIVPTRHMCLMGNVTLPAGVESAEVWTNMVNAYLRVGDE